MKPSSSEKLSINKSHINPYPIIIRNRIIKLEMLQGTWKIVSTQTNNNKNTAAIPPLPKVQQVLYT